MAIIERLYTNIYYLVSVVLFIIGFHTMLTHNNLLKKIMGMNIMDTSLFLFFVSIGYIRGGQAPILREGVMQYVNPVPSALILTGIVISVSFTAFALALVVLLHKHYGTIDADKIIALRSKRHA
ncbi:MAG: Na(+)/H(+) antiporter subunit C1 [Firmicutes bacterium]|nr:Na(+)/H(+) antiporter subunit C1 [candidate division NPL-UPA2 bacterium]MBT9154434.1 Na(+)/H(+) antiporter subunit C1 [candidate division NPL-UPA2 bacterium]